MLSVESFTPLVTVLTVEDLKPKDSFNSFESLDPETAFAPVIELELLAFCVEGVVEQLENKKNKMKQINQDNISLFTELIV